MTPEQPHLPAALTLARSPSSQAAAASEHQCWHTRIVDSVVDTIGNTPMVRLRHVGVRDGIKAELLVKVEAWNPGGSVKDRIAKRMVEAKEATGTLKPGATLIEPTSGNTGIGLALMSVVRGYKFIATMPEKMSGEKVATLRSLGADIVRTPTEAAWDSPESHISVAKRLHEEIADSWIPDQYSNPANPEAHYATTAEEIWTQCDGKVDMVVIGAGTGGTVTGIGKRLKELNPEIIVVGVDPVGSILAGDAPVASYQVEGIGYDFIPDVLDRGIVDRWVKTRDKESFLAARRMHREEGILCGGSSGSAVYAALQVAKELPEGKRVVILLADRKFLDDEWMLEHGFLSDEELMGDSGEQLPAWFRQTVADLELPETVVTASPTDTVRQVTSLMKDRAIDQVPVMSESGEVLGVVTQSGLLTAIARGRVQPSDPVFKGVYTKFPEVGPTTGLGVLQRLFQHHQGVIVTNAHETDVPKRILSIVTPIDLLTFLTRKFEVR